MDRGAVVASLVGGVHVGTVAQEEVCKGVGIEVVREDGKVLVGKAGAVWVVEAVEGWEERVGMKVADLVADLEEVGVEVRAGVLVEVLVFWWR